jgi:hypothetical protein
VAVSGSVAVRAKRKGRTFEKMGGNRCCEGINAEIRKQDMLINVSLSGAKLLAVPL